MILFLAILLIIKLSAQNNSFKNKVNFKIYDVTTWETNNCNTQLPYISESKGDQTIKYGQLIEYNMRNIFFENQS